MGGSCYISITVVQSYTGKYCCCLYKSTSTNKLYFFWYNDLLNKPLILLHIQVQHTWLVVHDMDSCVTCTTGMDSRATCSQKYSFFIFTAKLQELAGFCNGCKRNIFSCVTIHSHNCMFSQTLFLWQRAVLWVAIVFQYCWQVWWVFTQKQVISTTLCVHNP